MVEIIAEAGVNHDGDPAKAVELVRAAADAGADCIKFQVFRADALASRDAAKARYQIETTGAGASQREMLQSLELDSETFHRLKAEAEAAGLAFLATPFDMGSLDFLINDMKVDRIKIGSGDMNNAQLLHAAARSGRPLILSTGMALEDDVEAALRIVAHGYEGQGEPSAPAFDEAWKSDRGQGALAEKVTLLHCTTAYPAPFDQAELSAMAALRKRFRLDVGFSDHTPGIAVSIAAAALGACVIEKHLTLDKNAEGPDHRASLEPGEFRALTSGVRAAAAAVGDGIKRPAKAELENIAIARKSLTAAADISCGESFTEDNLTAMRPGNGVPAIRYWDFVGRTARRDYQPGEQIQPDEGPNDQ